MTWKREATKLAKDTTLIKAVREMEEPHGNWAVKCHLKMSVGKIMLSQFQTLSDGICPVGCKIQEF